MARVAQNQFYRSDYWGEVTLKGHLSPDPETEAPAKNSLHLAS